MLELGRMFRDVRPVDWAMLVIELLVLLLIAYEVGHNVWRPRTLRRRAKDVLQFVSKGTELVTGDSLASFGCDDQRSKG